MAYRKTAAVALAMLIGTGSVLADGFEPSATLGAELETVIRAAVGEYMGTAPPEQQDRAVACMRALVAPLGDEAKTELVATHMGGTGDVPLVEAHEPGLRAKIWACVPA